MLRMVFISYYLFLALISGRVFSQQVDAVKELQYYLDMRYWMIENSQVLDDYDFPVFKSNKFLERILLANLDNDRLVYLLKNDHSLMLASSSEENLIYDSIFQFLTGLKEVQEKAMSRLHDWLENGPDKKIINCRGRLDTFMKSVIYILEILTEDENIEKDVYQKELRWLEMMMTQVKYNLEESDHFLRTLKYQGNMKQVHFLESYLVKKKGAVGLFEVRKDYADSLVKSMTDALSCRPLSEDSFADGLTESCSSGIESHISLILGKDYLLDFAHLRDFLGENLDQIIRYRHCQSCHILPFILFKNADEEKKKVLTSKVSSVLNLLGFVDNIDTILNLKSDSDGMYEGYQGNGEYLIDRCFNRNSRPLSNFYNGRYDQHESSGLSPLMNVIINCHYADYSQQKTRSELSQFISSILSQLIIGVVDQTRYLKSSDINELINYWIGLNLPFEWYGDLLHFYLKWNGLPESQIAKKIIIDLKGEQYLDSVERQIESDNLAKAQSCLIDMDKDSSGCLWPHFDLIIKSMGKEYVSSFLTEKLEYILKNARQDISLNFLLYLLIQVDSDLLYSKAQKMFNQMIAETDGMVFEEGSAFLNEHFEVLQRLLIRAFENSLYHYVDPIQDLNAIKKLAYFAKSIHILPEQWWSKMDHSFEDGDFKNSIYFFLQFVLPDDMFREKLEILSTNRHKHFHNESLGSKIVSNFYQRRTLDSDKNISEDSDVIQKAFYPLLLASSIPQVSDYLTKNMDSLMKPNNTMYVDALYLILFAGKNETLKNHVVFSLKNRIENLEDNSDSIAEDERLDERQRSVFKRLAVASAKLNSKNDYFFEKSADLLLELNFDFSTLQKDIESWICRISSDHPFYRLSVIYAQRVLGVGFKEHLGSCEINQKKRYVFIGGSYDEQSIESDGNSPVNFLFNVYGRFFNSQSLIFFSGGQDHEKTALQMEQLHVPFEYGASTWENIFTTLKQWQDEKIDELTIFFKGHGHSRLGFSLWAPYEDGRNYSLVSKADVDKLALMFPNTRIKFLVFSCSAQSSMLHAQNKIPQSLNAFIRYVDYYYPAKRCFFAQSLSKEFAWSWPSSPHLTSDYSKGEWDPLFSLFPLPTLTQIQHFVFNRSKFKGVFHHSSTPNLSSDALAWDMATFICNDQERKSVYKSLSDKGKEAWHEIQKEFCEPTEYNLKSAELDQKISNIYDLREGNNSMNVQSERRQHIYERIDIRKELIKNLLSDPLLNKINFRYEEILQCEMGPIN